MADRKQGNDAASREKLSGGQDQFYDAVIVRKIRPIFENYINPTNLVYVFERYDPNVLVKKDIECVEATTANKGETNGALKLLDLLSKYENWLPCLIQVLKDKAVKQPHVANMILGTLDQLQSDGQVDTTVKALAERDVLIERLKAELENKKSEAETDKQNYETEIKKLRDELQNSQNMLQKEMDKSTATVREMSEQKVLAERDVRTEGPGREREISEQKVLTEREQTALAWRETWKKLMIALTTESSAISVSKKRPSLFYPYFLFPDQENKIHLQIRSYGINPKN